MRRIVLLAFVLLLIAGPTQATYTQQFTLSQDSVFQGQIMVAMLQSCANAMSEAATVAGHVARMNLCTQVLQHPQTWQPVFATVIASQSNNPMTPLTVPSTVLDSLVQTASDAQLSNIAGYFKQ